MTLATATPLAVPGICAMPLAGLGVFGWMARRRKQVALYGYDFQGPHRLLTLGSKNGVGAASAQRRPARWRGLDRGSRASSVGRLRAQVCNMYCNRLLTQGKRLTSGAALD